MITQISFIPELIRQRILAFQRPANTYTEGASAITERDCKAAMAFLETAKMRIPKLEMPLSVSPSVRGGIAMHWKSAGYELYTRISADSEGSAYYQWETPSGEYTYGESPENELIKKLSIIYA